MLKKKKKRSYSVTFLLWKKANLVINELSSMKMVYNFYPVKNINQDLESFFLFGLILDV